MTDVKVEQCDAAVAKQIVMRLMEPAISEFGQYEAFAADLIARHRQAAEKAQQERDAGVCEKVAADWQEKTKLYRSRGNNGPYLGEPTGWSLATAIRSQGHE